MDNIEVNSNGSSWNEQGNYSEIWFAMEKQSRLAQVEGNLARQFFILDAKFRFLAPLLTKAELKTLRQEKSELRKSFGDYNVKRNPTTTLLFNDRIEDFDILLGSLMNQKMPFLRIEDDDYGVL